MNESLSVVKDFKQYLLEARPLLDVRAPVEFNQGSFPAALNQPLLDDEQRHQIGVQYKQQGQDAAILMGEDLVSGSVKEKRIAQWLQFVNENPDGALFCFRGGLRSRITQQWIYDQSGINYPRIEGGYKAMRRFLIDKIDQSMFDISPIILSGRTGVGKTDLLVQLDNAIDLEGLTNHRGSTFGRRIGGQPTQINYENSLSIALMLHLQASFTKVVFEDEGPNIGSLHTPITVFEKTSISPCVLLEEPLQKRIEITLNEYVIQNSKQHREIDAENGFETYSQSLLEALSRIQRRLGSERYNQLREVMFDALRAQQQTGDVSKHEQWISVMLKQYYDPMYDYQIDKKQARVVFKGNTEEVHQYLIETSAG